MAAPAGATTYYVDSANGNDANPGSSEIRAWKSLSKASQVPLAPGDRLLLKRGGTWSGSLKLSRSGASATPILIGAYGTGSLPLIRGSCISLHGSYLILTDVQVDNCTWAGIDIYGDNNRVKQSLITRNVAGVFVRPGAVQNSVVDNVLKDNNRMSVLTASPNNDDSGAFGVLVQGDLTRVTHNTISGSDAFSYDYGRDGAAIEVYGGRQSSVQRNLALDNHTFTELGNSRSADSTYAYNVVRSSLPTSTFLVTCGASSGWGPVYRTGLYNNTVVLSGAASQGFICHAGCGTDILKMRNNIIQAVLKVGYADAAFDEDYDLFFGGTAQFKKGAHSVIAEPGFVDGAAGNLHLRAQSPGIERGTVVPYGRDFDGRFAPQDADGNGSASFDIGAYELPAP